MRADASERVGLGEVRLSKTDSDNKLERVQFHETVRLGRQNECRTEED